MERLELDVWAVFLDLGLLLGAAALFGTLFERLRQSAIVGYLVAGMLLGPGGFDFIGDAKVVGALAELGVSLLLFTIGLEFSLKRLASQGAFAVAGGSLQIVLTGFLFALGAWLCGIDPKPAIVLGAMVAPSSTACVVRLLSDRAEIDSLHGRRALGILLLQDLALVPLVLLIAVLGRGGGWQHALAHLAKGGLLFCLLVALLYGVSVLILPRLLNLTAALKNRELLVLLAAATALGASWVAHRLDLSPALGAFVAGLLIAGSPFAPQIRADVASLRTLFVSLFFVSVGMLGDLRWIPSHALALSVTVLVILLGKAVVLAVVGLAFRLSVRNAVATALCLAQVGEFSFVLGALAVGYGLLGTETFRLLSTSIILTMVATAYLVGVASGTGRVLEEWAIRVWPGRISLEVPEQARTAIAGHVVVVGYGPAGRQVLQTLKDRRIPVVVLEVNPKGVSAAQADGGIGFFGDASKPEVLEHAHLGSARALVVTVPDHRTAVSVIAQGVHIAPHVPIAARARYRQYAADLQAAGATWVVDEEENVGKEIGKTVAEICNPLGTNPAC